MDRKVDLAAMVLVQRLAVIAHRLALLIESPVVVCAPSLTDRLMLHCLVVVVLAVAVDRTAAAVGRIAVAAVAVVVAVPHLHRQRVAVLAGVHLVRAFLGRFVVLERVPCTLLLHVDVAHLCHRSVLSLAVL